MNNIHRGITILLASAVTGEERDLPEGFSLEAVLPIVKKQHLAPLVFQGAVNCGFSTKDPIMADLMQQYLKILIRSEKQIRAVRQLYDAFEENEIDYLPLKGCRMKTLYPKPELRTMGDADILIRDEQYGKVESLMTSLGYTLVHKNQHDYGWQREDLMVELHRYLISPTIPRLHRYFGNGWDRAIRETEYRYDFSPEDTFLYQFVHMTKHYQGQGIGSRHILDLYVYLRADPDMDDAYIEAELEKMHLQTFYRNIRRVLQVWFEDGIPDAVTDHITEFIFSAGSWGTRENGACTEVLLRSQAKGKPHNSRLDSLLRMIFPSIKDLEWRYPVLKKAPWVLPAVWVARWIDVLLHRRWAVATKMTVASKLTDDKVLARQRALSYVGLELGSGADEQA